MVDRDQIYEGSDLNDAEIKASRKWLRLRLKINGKLTGCTSYVQRQMDIGYNHAARLVEYQEACRFITEPDSTGERHCGPCWNDSD